MPDGLDFVYCGICIYQCTIFGLFIRQLNCLAKYVQTKVTLSMLVYNCYHIKYKKLSNNLVNLYLTIKNRIQTFHLFLSDPFLPIDKK